MPLKILIADDEALIRMLLQQTLEDFEEQGVDLLIAENGEMALQIIRAEKPQLVFLDVMMPKMNGFEICQMVKKELNMEHVYIVLLTAKGQDVDLQHGAQTGADIYITKPFDPDELVKLAKKVLAG